MKSKIRDLFALTVIGVSLGCGDSNAPVESPVMATSDSVETKTTAASSAKTVADRPLTLSQIRGKLGVSSDRLQHARGKVTGADLSRTPVKDLSPLAGQPLKFLNLQETPVSDLGPLKEMPLEALSLVSTKVSDLSPLKGMSLKEADFSQTKVVDLSPLEGMPLNILSLENTRVHDISALKGMPLKELYLMRSAVTDLSPLSGMTIDKLNLLGSPISDLTPLRTMKVNTLWLVKTQVKDLSPLNGVSLVSLDLEDTSVSDLSQIANMRTLRRLNIAGSQIEDLRPLASIPLERLLFTPSRIKQGLDIVRRIPSLQQLGTSFATSKPAARFWAELDAKD